MGIMRNICWSIAIVVERVNLCHVLFYLRRTKMECEWSWLRILCKAGFDIYGVEVLSSATRELFN